MDVLSLCAFKSLARLSGPALQPGPFVLPPVSSQHHRQADFSESINASPRLIPSLRGDNRTSLSEWWRLSVSTLQLASLAASLSVTIFKYSIGQSASGDGFERKLFA
jgi:hypothetical protein